MNQWENNVAVLLIFFVRPKQFAEVFEQVKKARPRMLFLYQDGPRKNVESDIVNISKCREIAENIDWDCEVHKLYQQDNFGCDPSEYIAQKWAFSYTDKCIILEEDDVPSQSFFPFCKEMLDKYENDNRINIISGQNILEKYEDNQSDYFFTHICAIWGWATWKRVIDLWDEKYSFFDNKNIIKKLNKESLKNEHLKMTLQTASRHRESGIAYYETILATTMYLYGMINIVPSKNMISNIGISADSTHSADSLTKLPRGIRRMFNMNVYEMDKKIKHPKYVICDNEYRRKVSRLNGWGHPLVNSWRNVEKVLILIKYAQFNRLFKKIKKSIQKK